MLLFLTDAPVVTRRKVVTVTAKSFIATIGKKIGTISGTTVIVGPNGSPLFVKRQTLLETLAKFTDSQFNEDPSSDVRDKRYRLFSQCRFTIVHEGQTILGATPGLPDLDTDVGTEPPQGGLQPDPLIVSRVTVSGKGSNLVKFSWIAKGRPHVAAEPPFQAVQRRTSVFIWHLVEGSIQITGDSPVVTATVTGSQFPSHRVFINGFSAVPHVRQGSFSNLWTPEPTDSTKVR